MARSSSADTRAAILAAARARFASDGYERATIRAIAADADIDPAMVMRYFGSKDRLFAAAADFDLRLPVPPDPPAGAGAAGRSSGAGGPGRSSGAGVAGAGSDGHPPGEALVRHFLSVWEADDTFIALLRAAATHPAARERMCVIFEDQVVAAATRLAPDRPRERAGVIAAQMLGLALTRYLLQFEPVVSMTSDDLVAWIGPTINQYLTAAQI